MWPFFQNNDHLSRRRKIWNYEKCIKRWLSSFDNNKKQLNRSIERGPINGNCSVAYPFSYYVHQSQYSSLQMMHFNLKRYLRNPHASFVCHFHHNYCNTRLWSYCDQNSLHNITVLVWKTHRKRISQDLNSTCNYIDIVKKKNTYRQKTKLSDKIVRRKWTPYFPCITVSGVTLRHVEV